MTALPFGMLRGFKSAKVIQHLVQPRVQEKL